MESWQQSPVQWVSVSQQVNTAISQVDFARLQSIDVAKEKCSPARLKTLDFWPESLKIDIILCQGELEHSLGNFDGARSYFTEVLQSGSRAQVARASYRVAEIAEQTFWAKPRRGKILRNARLAQEEIATFLSGVREARDAFMKVISYTDAFWSRRAAFRIITLMDDALWEIRSNLYSPNLTGTHSPFDFLFEHLVENTTLDQELYALEQERQLLEATLITELADTNDDAILASALQERARDPLAVSPSFAEFVKPPWADSLQGQSIVRFHHRYYRLQKEDMLHVIERNEALLELRQALTKPAQTTSFAFALAYLADETEVVPEKTIREAIESDDPSVQIAGLYAAETLASHNLTDYIIALWAKAGYEAGPDQSAFTELQNSLFGRKERLLNCLARHFSLGRHSTQKILTSTEIGDAEKAWLLQFRKDRYSSALASTYLKHPSAIVRARAHYAISTWSRETSNEV